MGGPVHPYYRVVPITVGPQVKSRVELPSYAMLWTGIAYVLWDEADPGKLNLMQQQALLDWLHWGGQLILSGPGTLGVLRNSFLDLHEIDSVIRGIIYMTSEFSRSFSQ